jgi:hypothetical protein
MKRDTRIPSGAMLFHFTRASRDATALDNLIAILRGGMIRGGVRMVRNKHPVGCFFDVRWDELREYLAHRNRRRYEPFGIALDKRYAFRMGARPVIYLPSKEARRILPEDEMWRVVSLDMNRNPPIDWSFEREWRVAGDLRLEPRKSVALVASWRDAEEVFDRFGSHPPCAGVIPLDVIAGVR